MNKKKTTEIILLPSYSHIADLEVNGKRFAVFEPGSWYCSRCEGQFNDPQQLDRWGHCEKCAEACCPDCGGEVVSESVLVYPATHVDPPEYARRWLCLGCGWGVSE